jgi:hypothetical protein
MESKEILMLKGRINNLESHVKRNLEPLIMSLYLEIDKLNKRLKAGNNSNGNGNEEEESGDDAMPNLQMQQQTGQPQTLESALQTIELLKAQQQRRMPQIMQQKQPMNIQRLPAGLSNSGKIIYN